MTAAVDIAILGGGPAGAAAARLLAMRGHSVVMLARAPARPALAESLPPSAGKLLDRVGVRAAIDHAGFVRATGNTVWWGTPDPRVEMFGVGALGWQVDRSRFDRLLLGEARQAGARLVYPAIVRDVVIDVGDDGTSTVHFEARSRASSLRARWVLDCTGRAGLLARREWRRADPAGRTLALAGVWHRRGGWDGLADDTHTLVESYDGGWAWSVPASRERRYVTVMVDPAVTDVRGARGAAGLTRLYTEELGKAPQLEQYIRAGVRPRLVGSPFARDASSYDAARVTEGGMLLVGDAASFIDPLSSYGIKKALASAWLASVVVHTALVDSAMRAPALELYERRERAVYDALRRRFVELSRHALGSEQAAFWRARSAGDHGEAGEPDGEPDVATFRRDPDVLAALAAMRQRSSVALSPSVRLARVHRPTVRGDRVALEEHLVVPAFRDGIRYIRSVDLVTIVALAPAYDQVPDLFAAYNGAARPVPLPDFLGALSVAVGKGMLDLA